MRISRTTTNFTVLDWRRQSSNLRLHQASCVRNSRTRTIFRIGSRFLHGWQSVDLDYVRDALSRQSILRGQRLSWKANKRGYAEQKFSSICNSNFFLALSFV